MKLTFWNCRNPFSYFYSQIHLRTYCFTSDGSRWIIEKVRATTTGKNGTTTCVQIPKLNLFWAISSMEIKGNKKNRKKNSLRIEAIRIRIFSFSYKIFRGSVYRSHSCFIFFFFLMIVVTMNRDVSNRNDVSYYHMALLLVHTWTMIYGQPH